MRLLPDQDAQDGGLYRMAVLDVVLGRDGHGARPPPLGGCWGLASSTVMSEPDKLDRPAVTVYIGAFHPRLNDLTVNRTVAESE